MPASKTTDSADSVGTIGTVHPPCRRRRFCCCWIARCDDDDDDDDDNAAAAARGRGRGRSGRPALPRLYVAARLALVLLGLVLFGLGLAAEFRFDRATWTNPILTPSLTALCFSAVDAVRVLRWRRRAHAHVRIVYDGVCLGTGLAVAGGFLAAWAVQAAPAMGYGLSAPILVGLFGMAAIEYGLGADGLREVLQAARGA